MTIVALAATVPMALAAADQLAGEGISAEVIDLRCLVPLDMATVLASVARTSRLLIVEENPYQGGWGGTVASIVADEGFSPAGRPDPPGRRRVCPAAVRRRPGGPGHPHRGQGRDRRPATLATYVTGAPDVVVQAESLADG